MLTFLFALTISVNTENDKTCELCYTAAKIVRDAIKQGYSDKQIKDALRASCPTLPSQYKPACEKALANIDGILADIHAGKDDKYICKQYGFCPNARLAEVENDPACDLCKGIIKMIEELLKQQATQEKIAEALQQVCALLEEPMKTLCSTMAKQYVPIIVEWIKQGIEKAQICKKLGFCEDSLGRNLDGVACDICTTLVEKIQELMIDKKLEAEIIAACKLLCAKMPAPYSTLCDALVGQYVPIIMKWLKEGLGKLEICKKLGFCTDVVRQTDTIQCDICTTIVEKIQELMIDQKVEAEIIAACKLLCRKVPAPYATLCDLFVQQYVPIIMRWLKEGLGKLEICKKIGLCNEIARYPEFDEDGITCDICKDFFKWAGQEIEKYTVPYLWKLVNEKCPNVPYLRKFCRNITEENIHTFVHLLISAVSPEEACHFIKIC